MKFLKRLKRLKRLFEIYKPFKKVVAILFIFLLIAQLLSLLHPYLYGKIIDAIFAREEFRSILKIIVITLIFNFASTIVGHSRGLYELNYFDVDISRFVSMITMEKMMKFSIGQHRNENSGIKQSVMNKGKNALKSLTSTIMYNIVPTVLQIT